MRTLYDAFPAPPKVVLLMAFLRSSQLPGPLLNMMVLAGVQIVLAEVQIVLAEVQMVSPLLTLLWLQQVLLDESPFFSPSFLFSLSCLPKPSALIRLGSV